MSIEKRACQKCRLFVLRYLTSALDNLNSKFFGMGVTFVQCGEVNYINNSVLANYPNNPVDNFLYEYSYLNTAVNVQISNEGGSYSYPPTYSDNSNNSIVHFGTDAALSPSLATFPHEVGHYFGLLHTYGNFNNGNNGNNGQPYNNPADPNPTVWPDQDGNVFRDHPYAEEGPRRELVIRVNYPMDSDKPFKIVNCTEAGDFVCDTPAGGSTSPTRSGYHTPNPDDPNCDVFPFSGCSPGFTYDAATCEYTGNYIDYNFDPIDPVTVSVFIENLMSSTGNCRQNFTQGQFDRMSFYLYGYENSRSSHLSASFLGNFTDEVEFEDTTDPVRNVRIKLTHPGDERFCIMTSSITGKIHGNHYLQTTKAERRKLGSNPDFSYSTEDWKNGVTTLDIVKIRRHILNLELLNGYRQIAADVNHTNSVTSADLVQIKKLILNDIVEFANHAEPWLFVPEYIVEDYAADFHDNPFDMVIDGAVETEAKYLNNDWEYTITNGENGDNGFDAIKIGDVTGSADFQFLGQNDEEVHANDDLKVEIKELEVLSDGFKVKFDVNSEAEKVAFQAGLEFDQTKLQYDDIETKNHLPEFTKDDNFGLTATNLGKLRFLWDSPLAEDETIEHNPSDFDVKFLSSLSEEEFLDELTISSIERGYGQGMPGEVIGGILKLDDTFFNAAYTAEGKRAEVKLFISPDFKVVNKTRRNEIMVYPNPFEQNVVFDFSHTDAEEGTLSIYDNFGKLVLQKTVDNLSENARLNLTTLSDIPVGSYFYNFQGDDRNSISGKFVKY